MRFGGDAFFRTPLGIATRNAIRQGLRKIIAAVPKQRWAARIDGKFSRPVIRAIGRVEADVSAANVGSSHEFTLCAARTSDPGIAPRASDKTGVR